MKKNLNLTWFLRMRMFYFRREPKLSAANYTNCTDQDTLCFAALKTNLSGADFNLLTRIFFCHELPELHE